VEQESATAFVEGYDSGIDVQAGLYQAALNSAFPVWLIVADGQPKFNVVADTHDKIGLRLFLFVTSKVLSKLLAMSALNI
jgi:hypothetical protein